MKEKEEETKKGNTPKNGGVLTRRTRFDSLQAVSECVHVILGDWNAEVCY